MLEPLEGKKLHAPAVVDRLAGIAVLVDQTIGAPRQVVAERVDRILGQGPHPQVDVAQALEALGHVAGEDRDEPRRQATLRDEGGVGALGKVSHHVRRRHVLGEVEIVGTALTRGLRHREVEVEGKGAHHRLALRD